MPETQGYGALPGILASIVRTKHQELEGLRERRGQLERAAAEAPPPRDFPGALAAGDAVALIAECKRRSPGAGEIRPGLDPAGLARSYEAAGARAISVLTDRDYFGGGLDDLRAVRAAVGLPVLRKDFTLDPLHVLEARGAGADAVLLIVRILDDPALKSLLELATDLGMGVLVETHHTGEVRRALDAGARIVGVNNRDLANFTTDLDTTVRALGEIPRDRVVVSESGIRTAADVVRLGEAGVDAVLVGETLLRASDPGAAARSLSSAPRRSRARP